jgi:hypothetical protein
MLILAVMAVWVVVVLATFPRGNAAATGHDTNRSTPDEDRQHYQFPTYA